ncbi:unnamed protein product, partial [Meganyctiphanes norvegica]
MAQKEEASTTPLLNKRKSMVQHEETETTPLLHKSAAGKDTSDSPKPASTGRAIQDFFQAVTIEPIMFLHALSYSFEGVFVENLWIDKICQNQYNYSSETCQNLDSGQYTVEQDNVQRWTTSYSMYRSVIETIPSLVAILFLGAWSDTRGRRLPVILPIYGYTLKCISYIINVIWWSLPPWCLIIVCIPYGLCGSMIGFFLGTYSYLGITTSKKARTSRFGIISVVYELAMPIGKYLGVKVFETYGYLGVFGIALILNVLAILYAYIRLENLAPKESNSQNTKDKSICSLLSPARVKKLLSVAFRKRENYGRTKIITLIIIMLLGMFSYGGNTYLYTRKKFGWNYRDYTFWSIFSTPVTMFASMIVLPFQSVYLGFEDYLIGFIGSSTEMFKNVIEGTAPDGWYMYLGTLVIIVGYGVSSSIRSALTKLVSPDEIGAVFAVLALAETFLP